MYQHRVQPIRIIARPKDFPLVDHWGVQLPDGRVIHLTPEGIKLESFEQFVDGRHWKEICLADPHRTSQIIWRANEALRRGSTYRLVDQNCEHFASWLLGGEPKSPQIKGLVHLGLIALALATLS